MFGIIVGVLFVVVGLAILFIQRELKLLREDLAATVDLIGALIDRYAELGVAQAASKAAEK